MVCNKVSRQCNRKKTGGFLLLCISECYYLFGAKNGLKVINMSVLTVLASGSAVHDISINLDCSPSRSREQVPSNFGLHPKSRVGIDTHMHSPSP